MKEPEIKVLIQFCFNYSLSLSGVPVYIKQTFLTV